MKELFGVLSHLIDIFGFLFVFLILFGWVYDICSDFSQRRKARKE